VADISVGGHAESMAAMRFNGTVNVGRFGLAADANADAKS
jgi:hypothetical protein